MKRPLSLRTYLTFSNILLISVSLGVIGFITSTRQQAELTDELKMQMLLRAHTLAASLEEDPDYYLPSESAMLELPGLGLKTPLSAFYVDDQRQFHSLTDFELSTAMQDLLLNIDREVSPGGAAAPEIALGPEGIEQIYLMVPIHTGEPSTNGTLCLLASLGPLRGFISRQRMAFGGLILGLSLLGVLSSILVTRPMMRRAEDVEDLAASVTQTGYRMHVPETGPREARQISSSLNAMMDRLQEQERERRTILSNITHELGRPLSGLRLGVESLQKGALENPGLAEDLLANMSQAIQLMEMLLEDISLAISPVSRPLTLHRTYVAVDPFLKGIASRFWNMAEVRGVKIITQTPPDLPQVFADEYRLRQILGNLIHNAIKFTPRGGTITVTAGAAGDNMLSFTVRDQGPGLDPGLVERLFDPFFQGASGKMIQQGMGLGLSIALQLTRLHGGELELQNHPAGGALAILKLPAEPT